MQILQFVIKTMHVFVLQSSTLYCAQGQPWRQEDAVSGHAVPLSTFCSVFFLTPSLVTCYFEVQLTSVYFLDCRPKIFTMTYLKKFTLSLCGHQTVEKGHFLSLQMHCSFVKVALNN